MQRVGWVVVFSGVGDGIEGETGKDDGKGGRRRAMSAHVRSKGVIRVSL